MGATASKDDAPFETLDADQVRDVVAGFGTHSTGPARAPDTLVDFHTGCGKEVLASIVSSDSMADASGFLLGM